MRARKQFSHLDARGRARMVDVGAKEVTERVARAAGTVWLGRALARRLRETGASAKGDVIGAARLAGIMGAKRTAELVPLCHPLPIDSVELEIEVGTDALRIEAQVSTRARTGVEMEALTAVSVAALTVYDMCKAVTKEMEIRSVRLLEKRGGKSGHWRAKRRGQER